MKAETHSREARQKQIQTAFCPSLVSVNTLLEDIITLNYSVLLDSAVSA